MLVTLLDLFQLGLRICELLLGGAVVLRELTLDGGKVDHGLLWLHLRVRLGRPGGLELVGDVADGLLQLIEFFFELIDLSL